MKPRRFFYLLLALFLSLLAACVIQDDAPAPPLTARQVVNYFAQEGLPIGNVTVYDEGTDPNKLLGTPGSYTSKVNFEDERTLGEYINTSSFAYVPNNTLEVFDSEDDARARYEYLASVSEGYIWEKHMFLEGCMLLRLDLSLSLEEAETYVTLLHTVSDQYDAAVNAPEVDRIIEGYVPPQEEGH